MPRRRRPERPLLKAEEEDNAQHRKVRARVEHLVSRVKNRRAPARRLGCREHMRDLLQAVAGSLSPQQAADLIRTRQM
ncbi:hypothetical protein ABZ678_36320 [Streptomyces hirsutus]|nr:hypothetical protein [Streptomyces hirsutus]